MDPSAGAWRRADCQPLTAAIISGFAQNEKRLLILAGISAIILRGGFHNTALLVLYESHNTETLDLAKRPAGKWLR
jgi:hypothetical protein